MPWTLNPTLHIIHIFLNVPKRLHIRPKRLHIRSLNHDSFFETSAVQRSGAAGLIPAAAAGSFKRKKDRTKDSLRGFLEFRS